MKRVVLVTALGVGGLAVISFYLYRQSLVAQVPVSQRSQPGITTSTQGVQGMKHGACLDNNEVLEYKIIKNSKKAGAVDATIKNTNTAETSGAFEVDSVDVGNASPLETHRCHLYVLREFNYDYARGMIIPGFSEELWKYDYGGSGEKVIVLGSRDPKGKDDVPFQFYFHVNSAETYITLTRGYSGSVDYAVVVKDLKTLDDELVLTQTDLVNKYGISQQYEIGAGRWLDDNTFLVFVTEGAVSYDEIVVHKAENGNWKSTVLPVPDDASVVTAWNPDGHWIGAEEVAQDIYKQWRAEGKMQSLFVYNLATKQKITLASKVDPAWSFKTTWISTSTLQYTPPSGTTSTYTIK